MNGFQKWGSALTLATILTGCTQPDETEKETTAPILVTQVQKQTSDTLLNTQVLSENEEKFPERIEIAGHTILARPLESIKLTPAQEKKFKKAGGYIIYVSKKTGKDKAIRIAKENPEAMIEWQENFETLEIKYEGTTYSGYDLFKKIYRNFPNTIFMSKEEAISAGLYPIIHYGNLAARRYIAQMYGGRLATLEKDHTGELRDIYNAAKGESNSEKLASMGQAPLGGYDLKNASVYLLDRWAMLGSDSINSDGKIYSLNIYNNDTIANTSQIGKNEGVSSIIILNK